MAEQTDVLICGSGSAGLSAAIWLARCGVDFKVLERRNGPLKVGQADGVQCRTVEVFESLGISEPLLRDAYHVMDITFWSSKGQDGIRRNHVGPDTEPGLSHQPHVILNQARINDIMIDEILRLRGNLGSNIEYACQVQDVKVAETMPGSAALDPYPVEVTVLKNGITRIYRAKYAIGCDGAHSTVRKSLGFKMIGDSTDAIWGVMDIYLDTDFPDIRKKTVINSEAGNLVLIPREGDFMVRCYMDLPGKSVPDVDLEYLHERASVIFKPYRINIAKTAWWSAYAIGQRLADFFTKDHRVFLTGDACHTHSPKAGQGMNVSLQDGYNIGWKLGHVLNGRAPPQLLETYILERQDTAAKLIDFDRYLTKLFSSAYRQEHGITEEHFKDQFLKAGRYTAGLATEYSSSILTRTEDSSGKVATNITVGMRFPSALVVRFSDGRPLQLAQVLPSDGRWHVVVFAGDTASSDSSKTLREAASDLTDIIRSYTPTAADLDSVINSIIIFSSPQTDSDAAYIPDLFYPRQGELQLRSLMKVFVDVESYNSTGSGNAFNSYGIDPRSNVVVIVRPDLYVSLVCELGRSDTIRDFFEGCLLHV